LQNASTKMNKQSECVRFSWHLALPFAVQPHRYLARDTPSANVARAVTQPLKQKCKLRYHHRLFHKLQSHMKKCTSI
jgi:hypothetical protein